jgi:hypothetical protein
VSVGNGKSRIDREGEAALSALRRARQRAERLARATGTYLVEAVDGKPVLVDPREDVTTDSAAAPKSPKPRG